MFDGAYFTCLAPPLLSRDRSFFAPSSPPLAITPRRRRASAHTPMPAYLYRRLPPPCFLRRHLSSAPSLARRLSSACLAITNNAASCRRLPSFLRLLASLLHAIRRHYPRRLSRLRGLPTATTTGNAARSCKRGKHVCAAMRALRAAALLPSRACRAQRAFQRAAYAAAPLRQATCGSKTFSRCKRAATQRRSTPVLAALAYCGAYACAPRRCRARRCAAAGARRPVRCL